MPISVRLLLSINPVRFDGKHARTTVAREPIVGKLSQSVGSARAINTSWALFRATWLQDIGGTGGVAAARQPTTGAWSAL